MNILKYHKPSDKKRIIVYDTGDIAVIRLDHYANIINEYYDKWIPANEIITETNFEEIDEDTNIKITIVKDDNFRIVVSGSTDGGSMDGVDIEIMED